MAVMVSAVLLLLLLQVLQQAVSLCAVAIILRIVLLGNLSFVLLGNLLAVFNFLMKQDALMD